MSVYEIRPFESADQEAVVALWVACGLTRPWNDPRRDIARKLDVQREMFLLAVQDGQVVGSVMAGYEGHRGWINYLGVDPRHRRQGIGRALMDEAERGLRELGCPKINLQVWRDNTAAMAFYQGIGFVEDAVLSFGKRLVDDEAR